jgi:hypothetical protein
MDVDEVNLARQPTQDHLHPVGIVVHADSAGVVQPDGSQFRSGGDFFNRVLEGQA